MPHATQSPRAVFVYTAGPEMWMGASQSRRGAGRAGCVDKSRFCVYLWQGSAGFSKSLTYHSFGLTCDIGAKFYRWAGNADGCVAVSARGGARGLRRQIQILRVFVARIYQVHQIHSFGLTHDTGAKFIPKTVSAIISAKSSQIRPPPTPHARPTKSSPYPVSSSAQISGVSIAAAHGTRREARNPSASAKKS